MGQKAGKKELTTHNATSQGTFCFTGEIIVAQVPLRTDS
jgi:hypothetical protein